MKKLSFFLSLILVLSLLAGCSENGTVTNTTEPEMSSQSESTQPEDPDPESSTPPVSATLPWESLTYDQFFSEDISYSNWEDTYRFSSCLRTAGGIAVDGGKLIPNTAELGLYSEQALFYCQPKNCIVYVSDGILYQHDVTSGVFTPLWDQGTVSPEFTVVCNTVLYFASQDQGKIQFYRLFLPELKIDLIFEYTSDPVPSKYLLVTAPESTLGSIAWRSLNPDFVPYLEDVLSDPDSPFCYEGDALQPGTQYIWENDIYHTDAPYGQDLVSLFHLIEKDCNIPFSIRGTYDPATGKEDIHTKANDSALSSEEMGDSAKDPVSRDVSYSDWAALTYDSFTAQPISFEWWDDYLAFPQASLRGNGIMVGSKTVPDSADLELTGDGLIFYCAPTEAVIYVSHNILFMQNIKTGEKTALWDQGVVSPNFAVAGKIVLYFCVQDQGTLQFYQLFLPELRIDLIYEYESGTVPLHYLQLFAPEYSTGTLVWRSIHPDFAPYLEKTLEDPNSRFITDGSDGRFANRYLWEDDYFLKSQPFDHSILVLCYDLEQYYGISYGITGTYDIATRTAELKTMDLKGFWNDG